MGNKRYLWIDALKGLGILSVMFVHVTDFKGPFLYALPLFFIVSGYLSSEKYDLGTFLKRAFMRLMVPYCLFYVLISVSAHPLGIFNAKWLQDSFVAFCKGGIWLWGDFGVFWFVTVLFVAMIAFQLLQRKGARWYVYLIIYILSMAVSFYKPFLQWNLQAVCIALVYMYMGRVIKEHWPPAAVEERCRKAGNIGLYLGLLALLLCMYVPGLSLDIKYNDYGVPALSFLLSVAAVMLLTVGCCKLPREGWLFESLVFLGRASMFLMFVHQFIHMRVIFAGSVYLQYVLTVALSALLYWGVSRNRVLRRYLCGES